eukprot:1159219-Pelagomonas_calceolata.AAC.2
MPSMTARSTAANEESLGSWQTTAFARCSDRHTGKQATTGRGTHVPCDMIPECTQEGKCDSEARRAEGQKGRRAEEQKPRRPKGQKPRRANVIVRPEKYGTYCDTLQMASIVRPRKWGFYWMQHSKNSTPPEV